MATSDSARRSESAGREAGGVRDPIAWYRTACLLRAVDEAVADLQLAGGLGPAARCTGLEALLVGVAAALGDRDWVLPGPRQAAIALARGASLDAYFGQVLGKVTDPSRGRQVPGHVSFRSLGVVSASTPVGSQLTHATGVGRAMLHSGRREAAVALAGQAAIATADWHVALNFAALWRVPVAFVIAVDDDLPMHSAGKDVHARAGAHGLAAAAVDGADAAAVAAALAAALDRARAGGGPTLIEARCPAPPDPTRRRLGPHAVDDTAWPDPLARMAGELAGSRRAAGGGTGAVDAQDLAEQARQAVAAAVARVKGLPGPPPDLLFDDVFARRTPALDEQRRRWRHDRAADERGKVDRAAAERAADERI